MVCTVHLAKYFNMHLCRLSVCVASFWSYCTPVKGMWGLHFFEVHCINTNIYWNIGWRSFCPSFRVWCKKDCGAVGTLNDDLADKNFSLTRPYPSYLAKLSHRSFYPVPELMTEHFCVFYTWSSFESTNTCVVNVVHEALVRYSVLFPELRWGRRCSAFLHCVDVSIVISSYLVQNTTKKPVIWWDICSTYALFDILVFIGAFSIRRRSAGWVIEGYVPTDTVVNSILTALKRLFDDSTVIVCSCHSNGSTVAFFGGLWSFVIYAEVWEMRFPVRMC